MSTITSSFKQRAIGSNREQSRAIAYNGQSLWRSHVQLVKLLCHDLNDQLALLKSVQFQKLVVNKSLRYWSADDCKRAAVGKLISEGISARRKEAGSNPSSTSKDAVEQRPIAKDIVPDAGQSIQHFRGDLISK